MVVDVGWVVKWENCVCVCGGGGGGRELGWEVDVVCFLFCCGGVILEEEFECDFGCCCCVRLYCRCVFKIGCE